MLFINSTMLIPVRIVEKLKELFNVINGRK